MGYVYLHNWAIVYVMTNRKKKNTSKSVSPFKKWIYEIEYATSQLTIYHIAEYEAN